MIKLTNSRLEVYLDFGADSSPIHLGTCLWYSEKGVTAFEWSEQALAHKLNLSPLHLPLQKGVILAKPDPFDGLHGMFSDSIPDGFGRRVMDKSFQKVGYSLAEVNPVHRLAWVGDRGIGALIYAPSLDFGGSKELMDIAELGQHATNADVDQFANIPLAAMKAGGSANGVRPKFLASLSKDGKSIILNDGALPPKDYTSCLIKFAPVRGDKNEPFLEAACLQLAREHGIKAADARLLSHPNGVALAVERFDRTPNGERILVQSLAAILDKDFRTPDLDYKDLWKVSKVLSGEPETERIYRQACFNVALSMKDDHCKNFAFVMEAAGKWELSPAYDLCPNEGPAGWQTMSVSNEAHNISRAHLLQFAKEIGLSEAVAKDGLDQARAASKSFANLAISLGAQKAATQRWAKAFKEIDKRLAPAVVPSANMK